MFRNLSTDALGFWAPQNEQIELAMSFGFKSIDIDIVDFAEQVETRGMEKARRLINSAKIKLGAFRLPIDLEAEDAAYRQRFDKLDGYAKLAGELDCRRALVKVAPASAARPMHENFELHRTRLTEIARALDSQKIQLGLDFDAPQHHREGKEFQFIDDFDALTKLADTVGRPNVGVVVDAWQIYVSGNNLDAVRKMAPERIVYVKIADAPSDVPREELKEEHRLAPGEGGAIDLVPFIKNLVAIRYAGPVTPVLHFGQFHGRRRDQAIRMMAEAIDALWKAAGLPPALKPRGYAPAEPAQPPKAQPQPENAEEAAQPA
jgi:sugar phosphate isomerase/epimerase